MGTLPAPRHVKLNGDYFRIDEFADVPFRRVADSMMAPRADISGIPGAVNLQRDVWSWTMTDFVGGEGRQIFDSSDPLGPPTFFTSDGGVDVRTRGEFSLHPDETLVNNLTGGGAVPTVNEWVDTELTELTAPTTFSAGAGAAHVRLGVGGSVQSPARSHGLGPSITVNVRFTQTRATKSNKKVDVRARIRNVTDSTNIHTKTATLKDMEAVTLSMNYTPAAGKTYRYYAENIDGGTGVTVDVARINEQEYGTGPAASSDIRDLRLGINEDVWALSYDGTSTDVLVWNFGTSAWDQVIADMVASEPRAMTGTDEWMYGLFANGQVWRWDASSAEFYARDPETANFEDPGEPLGIAAAKNRVFTLFGDSLFSLTPDLPGADIPLDDDNPDDYLLILNPGETFKEKTPDTTLRQHMTAIGGGVRWFVNVRGEQSIIYTADGDGNLSTPHFLPSGYIITSIKHYANITFIGAYFTNKAALPAEKRAALFFISADDLLRFLGYLRFTDTNSMPIAYINSYGHDVFMLQGRRLWRYNTGIGGLTLENEVSIEDETTARAMARMDKKFWVAAEGQGTFVAQDSYPLQTMWLTSPTWDFDVPDLEKVLLGFDIVTRALPANTHVQVEYAIDDGEWTAAGSQNTTGSVKTRFTISDVDETIKFSTLQFRVGLTSIDGVDTPRVLSATARALVLEYEDYFDMTLLAEDDDAGGRLISEHKTGRAKLEALWASKEQRELLEFEDWFSSSKVGDKDTYTVVIEDPFQETSEKGQSSVRLKLKVRT